MTGVAVAWKLTGLPAWPVAGTVAVQVRAQLWVTVMDPVLVHVVPPAVTVSTQVKVPPLAYVWLGLGSVEVLPSPKLHRKVGAVAPHPLGVAVAWKPVGVPAAVVVGTVALQLRLHPAVTWMCGVAEHVAVPSVTTRRG